MAVRIQTYVGLLYQDLIKANHLSAQRKLPPVLPIVLYNGEKPWQAPESVSELIQAMPEKLLSYQPQQRYLLIDEGRYSAAELESLDNLTAGLIRAEIAENPQQLSRVLANLIVWLPLPEQADLRRAFKEWFGRVLLPRRLPGSEIDAVRDLTEMQTMLAERVKTWTQPWWDEGFQKGIEQGIEQGEVALLVKQLTKRFGPLPAWATEKLQQAKRDQLDAWADRIFDAESLEQFFA